MTRVLSILVVACSMAANVGAAPVHDHEKPQSKKTADPKIANSSNNQERSNPPTKKAKTQSKKPKPYQVGMASWYGKKFHGKTTASGEDFDMFELTAAHKQLPLESYVKVTNLRNGKWVIVRINDRGPYVGNRIMDLSYSAARMLSFRAGVERVRLDLIEPATIASNQVIGTN